MEDSVVYFRDDDLGITDKLLKDYLQVWIDTDTKVNLECIPARLEPSTVKLLNSLGYNNFEIHQHGVSHLEYEPWNEFPASRSLEAVESSIDTGIRKLDKEFGVNFKKFFTPPWHNLNQKFYDLIYKKFIGISPIDIPIHIDMRIRDSQGPRWKTLAELKEEYNRIKELPQIGILLHHYLYNKQEDLQILKEFLQFLKNEREFKFFSELF